MSFHPQMPYGEGWHKSERFIPEEGPAFAFTPEHRARMRGAITWAATTAASVVDMAYHAGGGSSIYAGSPLQRRFQDVQGALGHAYLNSDPVARVFGGSLLGAPQELLP